MKLAIFGGVALAFGIWAMTEWWWFVVEVFQGFAALALVIGGALTVAIAVRKICRAKASAD